MVERLSGRPTVRSLTLTLVTASLLTWLAPAHTAAQIRSAGTRRFATTIDALAAFPIFFHTHLVRVRGTLAETKGGLALQHGEASILVVGQPAAGLVPDSTSREVVGAFIDVGRLTQGDPRLTGIDVERLSQERLGKPWPGQNELPLLVAEAIDPAPPFPAPSIRALALTPERYADARVSITGRFRGRNLYGDQPDAPGRSRYDFVLQSADASIWVVGLRPRGPGFNFSVESRVDTDKWLTVSGVVRHDRRLVVLEAVGVTQAQPPADTAPPEVVVRVPAVGPRPEVVFSAPTADETDVSLNSRVRIQFSRDLDPESIKGQIRAGYLGAQATERGEPQAPEFAFSTSYDEGTRVLEIRFPAPLERFRTLKIELLDGIKATDGATLVPWTLTFSLGG